MNGSASVRKSECKYLTLKHKNCVPCDDNMVMMMDEVEEIRRMNLFDFIAAILFIF